MKNIFLYLPILFILACSGEDTHSEFTGNQVEYTLIPSNVNNIETTGNLVIKEKTDGTAQLEITINGVLNNAVHPAHLHYGSLADDGNIATMLNPVVETEGKGKSITVLNELANDEQITYSGLMSFNGSIKVHFEASGPLKDEVIGSVNIGTNSDQNEAFLNGDKSIKMCNSEY